MIDAKGKFVFPGFIDPHVHIYLPFMGTFSKDDDYITGSRASASSVAQPRLSRCAARRAPTTR